jgi:hypothetical protein
MRPHVKIGNRYRMGEGEIEVDSILPTSTTSSRWRVPRDSGRWTCSALRTAEARTPWCA